MELKDLKSLIKLVTDTDITEFNMENQGEKIHIKRGPDKEIVHVSAPVAPVAAAMPVVSAPSAVPAPQGSAVALPVVDDKHDVVPSPMVGTAYRRPSPEADPFVKVGDVVDAGQTLCLIEAMKLFNEVEAEFKCKIIEIVKDDATPVEFGETLFIVEKL